MLQLAQGIFFRHVLRHVAWSTLAVFVVLLVVLFAYQLAFVLGRAADGQLPGELVLRLVGLTLRGNLNVILPFAVVLGVVLGLGRLHHDSEIAAAHAGGVGTSTLYAAAGTVIFVVAAVAAWMAFVDGPVAAGQVVHLRTEALRTAVTRGLVPGQFRALGHGVTLYARSADADGTLRDVFMQRDLPSRQTDGKTQIVLAESARYAVSADSNYYTVDMQNGHSYEGVPGAAQWRISRFARQFIRVPAPQARLPGRPRLDAVPSGELLVSSSPLLRGELHWRIGWVCAVIVLGLLAVPLSRLSPRQGRYARVPWVILLFAVYAGLLTTGRLMLERQQLPAVLGLWWVHAAAVLLGAGLLRALRR